jgi:hypothetical protein
MSFQKHRLIYKAESNGDVPKNNRSNEQLSKAIEPKVSRVIEHKTETPSKK